MYKLIIVDDEKIIVDGIREIFPWNNIGFEVAGGFTHANDALEFLENEKVDVVLTDISMPDIDGLELAKRLKKHSDLLVIILSSYSNYNYMRQALQIDIVDYLLKPVSYGELLECFEKAKDILDRRNPVHEEMEETYYGKMLSIVDDYLETNFQNAKLVEAAEAAGISANYLSKIYKQKKGIRFLDKLHQIRMEKAAELLMTPEIKGYEIAYCVGYDSPKNFTRAFKAYYHVTPSEYKNGVRGGEQK